MLLQSRSVFRSLCLLPALWSLWCLPFNSDFSTICSSFLRARICIAEGAWLSPHPHPLLRLRNYWEAAPVGSPWCVSNYFSGMAVCSREGLANHPLTLVTILKRGLGGAGGACSERKLSTDPSLVFPWQVEGRKRLSILDFLFLGAHSCCVTLVRLGGRIGLVWIGLLLAKKCKGQI